MNEYREIKINDVIEVVKELCMDANYNIGDDVVKSLKEFKKVEDYDVAKDILDQLITNYKIASEERISTCQDTGMAVLFVELGQEVLIKGGLLSDGINEGVKKGYDKGYLRKSIVTDPIFDRKNTNNNTPPIIHYDLVSGNKLKITFAPKGFGSENMSSIKLLKPSDGVKGVKEFIIDTVKKAGPNPCPPIVVGVGIGGTYEKAAIISKKALLRPLGEKNNDTRYAKLEKELLDEINNLGIGPQGFGGRTTALAVNVEYFPTHIAGLPVAVNICCHAVRHKSIII